MFRFDFTKKSLKKSITSVSRPACPRRCTATPATATMQACGTARLCTPAAAHPSPQREEKRNRQTDEATTWAEHRPSGHAPRLFDGCPLAARALALLSEGAQHSTPRGAIMPA